MPHMDAMRYAVGGIDNKQLQSSGPFYGQIHVERLAMCHIAWPNTF